MSTAIAIVGVLLVCGLCFCLYVLECVYHYRNATATLDHALKASDPIPFGRYRGTRMDAVPASYLHWLWVNKRDPLRIKAATDPVAAYIHNHLEELKAEYQHGAWE